MNASTSVGRGRRRARLALLALTASAACTGLCAPALANDITPPTIYTVTPTGVNVSDGGFTFTNTDLSIGSLSLERFWLGGNIHDPNAPFFGAHMSHNFDIYYKEHQTTLKGPPVTYYSRGIVHIGNTASGTYDVAYSVSPRYISANTDDAHAGILELSGSAYVYTDQSGTVYTFNPSVPVNGASGVTQRVGSILYANGRKLTFSYDSNRNLKMVTSSDGYALVFENSGGNVTAACGFNLSRSVVTAATTCSGAAIRASYGYVSGQLGSFTDTVGQTTQYGYASGELSCITPPGYATCKIANTYLSNGYGFYRVSQQTLADGSVWSFMGGSPNTRDPDYQPENGETGVGVTDPDQHLSVFSFTKSSPYSFTDANSHGDVDAAAHTTQYRYTGGSSYDAYDPNLAFGSMLVQAIMPEGNEYRASYSPDHFNLPATRTWVPKANSGLLNQTEQFTYPDCTPPGARQSCVHPSSITNARGFSTDYQYNAHGQPLSEMQPAPTSGAARPLKLYSYLDKYAYVLDASGFLIPSATPVSMPSTDTQCQTVAGSSSPSCDPAATQLVTSYEYGADGTVDNLLLKGKVLTADGQSRRTCLAYDPQGNKLAETSPRAGLASCP